MKSLAARRRHPLAAAALLLLALGAAGAGYAAIANTQPAEAAIGSQTQVEEGNKLYLEGCSSCHGLEGQGTATGPSLIGVGAAAVDFQVSSGRMPLAAPGAQAVAKDPSYTEEEITALAAFVASLAPGPAIPTAEQLDFADADVAQGGVLYRVNCAQCHQAAAQGGALTQGKYAPSLMGATPKDMYEAMVTGPQSMPVFADSTLPEQDKKAIMAYVTSMQEASSPGGLALGRLGPVTEGLFAWTAAAAALIGAAVWIGIKAR